MNFNKDNLTKELNDKIYERTKYYQKKYGFEIGTGKNDTYINGFEVVRYAKKVNPLKIVIKSAFINIINQSFLLLFCENILNIKVVI